MKKMTTILMSTLLLGVGLVQTGCFGEFALVRKVYKWNQSIGSDDIGGRFVRTLVYYVFSIIPVYGVAAFVDVVVLNLIEFWTGSNPLALNEGDMEKQMVNYMGNKYEITATKNQFEIVQLTGTDKGKTTQLIFDAGTSTWTMNNDKGSQKLMQIKGNEVIFNTPSGEVTKNMNELNSTAADMAMAQ
jgi:hypothetical protein